MGASLAFGACSSDIPNTYFTRLAALLAQKSYPPEITVLAAGGWKSSQELEALQRFGFPSRPDVVLFLDGLNDLTNGSNARVVYGVPTKTLDGSPWHGLYHEHDYPDRVRAYLDNMGAAVRLLRDNRTRVVLALQPSLFEKKTLTPLEQKLAKNTLHYLGNPEDLRTSYERMRAGLGGVGACRGGFVRGPFPDLRRRQRHYVSRCLALPGPRSQDSGGTSGGRVAAGAAYALMVSLPKSQATIFRVSAERLIKWAQAAARWPIRASSTVGLRLRTDSKNFWKWTTVASRPRSR